MDRLLTRFEIWWFERQIRRGKVQPYERAPRWELCGLCLLLDVLYEIVELSQAIASDATCERMPLHYGPRETFPLGTRIRMVLFPKRTSLHLMQRRVP
jgi:hypothetical protein